MDNREKEGEWRKGEEEKLDEVGEVGEVGEMVDENKLCILIVVMKLFVIL